MARQPSVQLDWKQAALSTAFGRDWATKLFGEAAIASLPILKTGKNKGHPKGFVHWRKALTSGFIPGYGPAKVGQLIDAWIAEGQLALRENAMRGEWMGRMQNLAGSSSMLFEQAREAELVRVSRDKAGDAEISGDHCVKTEQFANAIIHYTKALAIYDGIAGQEWRATALRSEIQRLEAIVASPC